jgi:hypothetical protein
LDAVFWKHNEWKLREIVQDFESESVLMGKKKIVSLSNLLLLRREMFLCGYVLKGQRVILVKWENFGTF